MEHQANRQMPPPADENPAAVTEVETSADSFVAGEYDVVVIGAGHAGCEAALAAARLGVRTILITLSMDSVAMAPCNPSVGGPAKGVIVREIDAMGGAMGKIADRTQIQIRLLNTSKGPAVRALRAQINKKEYQSEMLQYMQRADAAGYTGICMISLLVRSASTNSVSKPQ